MYAGSFDRGLTSPDLADLQRRLPGLAERRPTLARPPRKPKAKWVLPRVKVDVVYPNKGTCGRLQHPWFKGPRDDFNKV